MSGLRGRYPGGPSRRADPDDDTPHRGKVHLASVAEIEAKAAAGALHRRGQSRKKRLYIGLTVSVALALALGGYIGFSSHRTADELVQEMEGAATKAGKSDLDRQMDRMIDEMWKSEALEKGPGGR